MKLRQWTLAAKPDMDRIAPDWRGADVILVFGAVDYFEDSAWMARLLATAPDSVWVGCSTAGEIAGANVFDHSCVLTALSFAHADSRVVLSTARLARMSDSHAAGARLAAGLPADGLRAVLLLGTGVAINGSALVLGVQSQVAPDVQISGGLAADGGAFARTWTTCASGAASDQLLALGFYGSRLVLENSSFGGWEAFGPARKITRCHENVLFELDGERALDIYKRYLGEYASQLPASGLLFPFDMLGPDRSGSSGVIRTILGVDEAAGSLLLAGDIDPDGYLRLMHSSTDKLIQGAEHAAQAVAPALAGSEQMLALLVSCIGRKLVMGDRVEEEVEAVMDTLGPDVIGCGFYSNGEISEAAARTECRLYNQTMTITLVGER
ncbi:FIST signal transduction protein [Paludibacterium yongneupense]|uniref:FIST signal transduction protein n=1 Tax=Paludibacterium yongneupense TaxID=400061 RepID=UPI00048AAF9F|nr:FIST N-terminal domain-containing protein [Paludibacterium yongneupense]